MVTSYTVVVDPVNTKHPYNIYTTPAQRLRRWTSIAPMPHECSVLTGKCIKSYTRILPEKHKTMIQCQANAGPTLKAVCHLCGSIGPMSSVSRYLLWQCGNAISYTMAHENRDPSKHETPKQCWADTGPKSWTMGQHQTDTGSTSRVCRDVRSN